uniref:Uncharacterized protein n=1 Tax=Globodera rostochiensis TaxID=31243 RepID=A0A914I0T5_GLORO
MTVPYRIIFLIFLTVIPFVTIAYPSPDADNSSTNDATVYVYFKGVVQGRRENEVVVDIFCGQTGRNISFYTGARGQFEFPIDEQFLRYFRGCTAEGITIGFYKKDTNDARQSCLGCLVSPREAQNKRVLKCFVSVRYSWLNFGGIRFTQQYKDHVNANAEPQNVFNVDFAHGGSATINGNEVRCTDHFPLRDYGLYNEYFDSDDD